MELKVKAADLQVRAKHAKDLSQQKMSIAKKKCDADKERLEAVARTEKKT